MILSILLGSLKSSLSAPDWVPKKRRPYYDKLYKYAKEYVQILRTDVEIVGCKVKDKYVIIAVKKATIYIEIEIGEFEDVQNWKFKDNKVEITYRRKASTDLKGKFIWGVVGYTLGVGTVVLIILLL